MTTKSAKKDYKSMYEQMSQKYDALDEECITALAEKQVEAKKEAEASAKKILELEAKLEKFQEAEARLAEYEEAESAYNKKFLRRTNKPKK